MLLWARLPILSDFASETHCSVFSCLANEAERAIQISYQTSLNSICFTTKLAHRLRNTGFRNVSEKAFQASFPENQISFVLRGISFRGCESLVFVTYLNLSLNALSSTLIHSTPLHSTPLLCRCSDQGNTRKQTLLSVVN